MRAIFPNVAFLLTLITASIRFAFYPLRLIWSGLYYPPQFSRKKTAKHTGTKQHTSQNGSNDNIWLYIPGSGETDLKNPEFLSSVDQDDTVEVIPAPSYDQWWLPFSLRAWADRIIDRIATIRKDKPHAKIFCYGFSMGGAALALASKQSFENTRYALVNTFNSLPNIFWHQPEFSILMLTAHLVPAILVVLLLGIHSNKLLLTAGILAGITAVAFSFSFAYLALKPKFHRFHNYVHFTNHTNLLRFGLIRYFWYGLTSLLYYFLKTVFLPFRCTSQALIYGQLWLMNAHHRLDKDLDSKKVWVHQCLCDETIPLKAQMSKNLGHIATVIVDEKWGHEHRDHASIITRLQGQ